MTETAPHDDATLGVPPGVNPAELEMLCITLAQQAAQLVTQERPRDLEVADTKSSETDVVTLMDRRSEEALRAWILEARPDDAILGEEGEDHPGTTGLTWVIDPIDGTVNYLYDIPAHCVSVAVCVGTPRQPGRWRTLAGAVADGVSERTFHARVDGAAGVIEADSTRRQLQARRGAPLERALVATGFGYDAGVRRRQAELLLDVLPRVRDIRRFGSAALDLCRVAEGTVDAYYETGLNPWDLAAGWLIAERAGAVVTGREPGDAPSEALTIAGDEALVEALRPLVAHDTHGGNTAG